MCNQNMQEFSETSNNSTNQNSTNILEELMLQIVALLRNNLGTQSTTTNFENLSIKVCRDNYALWETFMRKVIGGRRTGPHISRESSLPSKAERVVCIQLVDSKY